MPVRAWLVIGAAVLACTGCADSGPGNLTAPRINTSLLSADVESLWTPGDPGTGGYGEVDSLDAQPALYATAWSVRLARALKQTPSRLSVRATAAWLSQRLANPTDAGYPPDSLPPLYRAWLAARALDDLGEPASSSTVTAALSAFGPSHGMYRISAQQAPSWGATRIAEQIQRLAHIDPSGETVSAVRADLYNALRPGAPALDVDEFIPVWVAADDLLSASDRAPFRLALDRRIKDVVKHLASGATSGETLSVASDLLAIADSNSLPRPALDLHALVDPLRKATGYLSVSTADAAGDPQVTYDAVSLGMAVTPALRDSLETHLLPTGWRIDVGRVDPMISYYCEAILESLGVTRHRAALAAQESRWLKALHADAADGGAADRRAYFVISLAKMTDATVPPAVAAGLSRRLQNSGKQSNLDDAWLLGLAQTLGVQLPESIRARLSAAAGAPTPTLQDLDLHLLIQALLAQPPTIPPADWWSKLRSFDGYRASANALIPDLAATSVAARALSLSSGERSALLGPFVHQGEVYFAPARLSTADGNVASPQAAYLGLYLLGDIHDDAAIHI